MRGAGHPAIVLAAGLTHPRRAARCRRRHFASGLPPSDILAGRHVMSSLLSTVPPIRLAHGFGSASTSSAIGVRVPRNWS